MQNFAFLVPDNSTQLVGTTSMETFAKPIEDISNPITQPSVIAEGGVQQINLKKLDPEQIERLLLLHPVVPRGVEIRANRMTSRGYTITPKNQAQRAKAAAKEMADLIKNAGGSIFLNNLIRNSYGFGDGYATLVPNISDTKIVTLHLEHPVFFRIARHKKKNHEDSTKELGIYSPEQADNFNQEYGAMKINPKTKKPESYVQVKHDASRSLWVPSGQEIPAGQVVHLLFDTWGDEVTGISVIQYIHRILIYIMNIEEAGAEAQYRAGFTQKKVTTEIRTERELKELARNAKSWNSSDVLILPTGVDITNLTPGSTEFEKYHDRFITLLAIRIGVPKPILTLDGENTNKATIDELMKDMMSDLRADEIKVEKVINEQIFMQACRKLYGDNFEDYPVFSFNPFRESEDAKAARNFRIAQTLDSITKAAQTSINSGYIEAANRIMQFINQVIPDVEVEGLKEIKDNANITRRDTTVKTIPGPTEKENIKSDRGRSEGTDSSNIRGERLKEVPTPNLK